MSRVVWKYSISAAAWQQISMPAGAQIIHVAEQDEFPTIWALVDPDATHEDRAFYLRATGEPVPDGALYIGTFHVGRFVFHLFTDPDYGA